MSAINIVKWREGLYEDEGREHYDATYWKSDEEGQVRVAGLSLLRVMWLLWRMRP